MSEKGILIVVSAPSGCGKSTVLRRLMEMREKLHFSVSATTRSPREGEVDGEHYYFIDRARFEKMIQDGAFLEYAQYVNNYYGTPRGPVETQLENGFDVYLDIEVQGAMQVKSRMPEAVMVFLMPPSMEALKQRLTLRGTEDAETVRLRLREAERECSFSNQYEYIVVNDDVDRAAREISDIMDRRKNAMKS